MPALAHLSLDAPAKRRRLTMFDRWLPPELKASPSTRIRAETGLVFSLIYVLTVSLQTLGYLWNGDWVTAGCLAATIPIMAIAPWSLLRLRSLEVSAHVHAAVTFGLIVVLNYLHGPVEWRALMWVGPPLLYTLLVGGVRPAVIWLVIGLSGIVGAFSLGAAGFPFPVDDGVEPAPVTDMMQFIFMPITILGLAFIYHRVNLSVLDQLRLTSSALVRIRDGLDEAQRLARVGSWEFDGATERLTWSKTLFELLALPPGPPMTVEQALEHVFVDDRAVILGLFAGVRERGGRAEADVRMPRGDEVRVFHFIFSRTNAQDSERVLIAGTTQDVTEARETEAELLRTRKQAMVASEAKSQFLSHMSHEIRTPMNGVIGLTGLALGTDLDAEQREYIEGARTAGMNLLTIIDDILDISKVEAGELRTEQIPFSLQKVLGEVVETVAYSATRKGLELSLDIDSTLAPAFLGDPVRIRQIVLNLVGNAVKFTAKGTVVLIARVDPELPGALRVIVEDTGPGISEDAQLRIFESFQQADVSTTRQFGGTGLGLTISRKLAELLRGRLWVESELGVGSRFHLQLPLTAFTPPEVLPSPVDTVDSAPEPVRSLVVLLAEDSAVNLLVASRLLGRAGHRVIQVKNGRDAVHAALTERVDVVLMDVQMPEMDGLEATRLIRRHEALHGGYLPIVALTAGAMKGDDEACIAAGMDAYLSKPLDPRRLESTVLLHAERRQIAPRA